MNSLDTLTVRIDSYGIMHSVRLTLWTGYSVVGIATGCTVRGSNPGRGEIFRVCPDRPLAPSSLLYNGYRIFPRG